MQKVVITRHGGPEVFQRVELPDPSPGADEVRIRVHAAGVNFADVLARVGLYPDAPPPPVVVGYEVAGLVDAVGSAVDSVRVGDRVVALTRFGGYADAAIVPEEQVLPIPDGKGFVEAAALPVNYLTAFIMLERLASIRPGDRVLIHGAAGGVGLAALQLSKALEATTFGTASPGKHERLLSMGLDHAIDYRSKDFEREIRALTGGEGLDVILDPIGGSTTRKNYRLLNPMGRLFLFGISSTSQGTRRRNLLHSLRSILRTPFFHPFQLMNDNKGVMGINLGRLWSEKERIRGMFRELADRWARGQVEPVIDSTFPLERVGEAHDRLQDRLNFGKVVLTTPYEESNR